MADTPAPKTPDAKPAAKPAAEAKPAAKPEAPAPTPTGPAANFMDVPGATFAVLEDGVGVVTVPADEIFGAVLRAKSQGFTLLSLLSAYDRTDHFGVIYALVKPTATQLEELRFRVVMPKKVGETVVEPQCPSLVDIFPAADWQEREMYDMYGIQFVGHPDLRRMFLPDGWTGFPGRKDYKEAEQFIALRDGEDMVVKTEEPGAW